MLPGGLSLLFWPAGIIPGTTFAAISGVMRSQAGLVAPVEVLGGGAGVFWFPGCEHPPRTADAARNRTGTAARLLTG